MVSTMTWTEVETKTGSIGDDALGALVGRSGHSITISENMMFMVGGETKPRGPLGNEVYALDQVYALDLDSRVWQPVEIYGKLRPSIAHGAAAQKNLICVFGGHSGVAMSDAGDNCTYTMRIDTPYSFGASFCDWTIPASGICGPLRESLEEPPPRSYPAMAANPDTTKIYLFGGCGPTGQGRLNDLWEFDALAYCQCLGPWSQLPTCDAIEGRAGAGLVVDVAGKVLYVVGGYAGRQMGDVHRFDLVSKTWEEVKTPANPLPPRSMFGGAHVLGRLIVVACGAVGSSDMMHGGAGSYSNDVYALNLDKINEGWQRVPVAGSPPSPRGWFATAVTPQGLILHGGISPENECLSSMYLLSVSEGECEDIEQALARVGLADEE